MTRRSLAALLPVALAAQQDPRALDEEFTALINAFSIAWNDLMGYKLRGTWNYKAAGAVEKAFKNLTSHPGWLHAK